MSQAATVVKIAHTKDQNGHYYGATMEITTDPGDPEAEPPVPPTTTTVVFVFDPEDEGDMEFYRDLRAAHTGGKPIEVDWSEIPPPSTPKKGALTGVHIGA